MTTQPYQRLGSLIAEEVMKVLRQFVKKNGSGKEDDYSPLVELAELIENTPQKPENAHQMIDGNGDVVRYNQDPSEINQKFPMKSSSNSI